MEADIPVINPNGLGFMDNHRRMGKKQGWEEAGTKPPEVSDFANALRIGVYTTVREHISAIYL